MKGPLKMANSAVDAIDLQYYEGFPADQVARGEVTTPEQWTALNTLKTAIRNLFSPRVLSRKTWHIRC